MRLGDPLLPLLRGLTDLTARGARDLRHLERTGRFLVGLREFSGRDDDVFISSYPRSGTTWVQLITHLVLRGGGLDFRHINQAVPWFERELALGRLRAADYEALPSPRAFKSHLPRRFLPPRGRYVYVCRDGLDVVQSYFAFYRSHLGFSGGLPEFFERFMKGRLQYRSWFDHVAGWQSQTRDPRVLWLSYEEMRREPESTIEVLAAFLGVSLTRKRVREIAGLSSFDTMRAHEALFDHAADERHHSQVAGGQFVREGRVGTGQSLLTERQKAAFERRLTALRSRRPRLADLPAFLH